MTNGVPTILVGLGGIGSSIVNDIYGKIPEDRRKNVAIHAFDTDVNSIKSLKHIADNVTQTSTRKSVGEYLHLNPSLKEWFPNNPFLLNKTMTEGAGQIRAVSRLAFRSAMDERKLNKLEESIDRIFPVTSSSVVQGVRVIIVSSLVGGTGSGIFLQVAMYLRELLEKKHGHSSVLIRGAFLLPDIFVRTNTIDRTEVETVQANGYAALKELNAITMSATGQLKNEEEVTINLEYRPNQVDLEGRTAHAVTNRQLPFNFCFLYDYENIEGKNLPSLKAYLNQISKTIYLQLFSPISSQQFSKEDNQILHYIKSEGKAFYSGAGAASLQYPYEDVLEYLSLRWAANGLDESWLLLDKKYEVEYQSYEKDFRRGINRERPNRGERYRWNLDAIVSEDNPNPFFKQIHRQTCIELEDGKLGPSKASLFLAAVKKRIDHVLDTDQELENVHRRCYVDEELLKDKHNSKQEISKMEANLKRYEELINRRMHEYQVSLAYQIIDEDADSPSGADGQDYKLNTWFLKKNNPVHPVAVRYMLYELKSLLEKEASELRGKVLDLQGEIKDYEKAYDLRTTDTFETAHIRIDRAFEQGLVGKVFRNEFKEFVKEYITKSNRQLRTLNEYKFALLTQLVFNNIGEAIDSMIQDWERFFENLKDTANNLQTDIDLLSVKFEQNNDPTMQFVLADKDMLEEMWKQIRGFVDQGVLPDDISSQIYLSHYKQYCARKEKTFGNYVKEISVEEMYRTHVLGYCRNELNTRYHDRIDLSIIQALRREANILGVDPNDHIEKRVKALNNLSSPFIPKVEGRRELFNWGVHPQVEEDLGDTLLHAIFNGTEVVDDAFSKHEVVIYKAHYGLRIDHFSKFSSGDNKYLPGTYYEAYKRRIDSLNKGESTVTPHLDKNWHLPYFMPDLNESQVKLDLEKIDRSLLIGIIYGWLELVNENDKRVYMYSGKSAPTLITKGGELVDEGTYLLHNALAQNPNIYHEILDHYDEQVNEDRRNSRDISQHRFVKGALDISHLKKNHLNNILDLVLYYDEEGLGDSSLPEKKNRLMLQLLNEIEAYFLQAYGNHNEYRAGQEAAALIKNLEENSAYLQEKDRDSSTFKIIKKTLKDKVKQLVN